MPLWVSFDLFMASRFWESLTRTKETEKQRRRREQEDNREEEYVENTVKPTLESESIMDQESWVALETKKKLEFLKEFEGSIKERLLSSSNIEELKAVDVFVAPFILTRCKSEPARTREELDPDSNFWKRRRLGLTLSLAHTYNCFVIKSIIKISISFILFFY